MEFIHTELKRHPLREAWMVFTPKLPFIPPYIGTKKECKKARVSAERNAAKYLATNNS